MGLKAYAVYSLYCRMARQGDGQAWPGFEYICKALQIGRSTLVECNRTLEALGLIEVERGRPGTEQPLFSAGGGQALSTERLQESIKRARALRLHRLVEALGVVLAEDQGSPEQGPTQSPAGTEVVPVEDQGSPGRGLEQDPTNKTQEQHPGTRVVRS